MIRLLPPGVHPARHRVSERLQREGPKAFILISLNLSTNSKKAAAEAALPVNELL